MNFHVWFFFTKIVLILQNVLIFPNCILPMHSSTKCVNTKTHFYNFSINIGSISFFSSSDMHQFHHLSGYHATGINSLLNSFFKFFSFYKFNMPGQSLIRIIVSGSSSSKLSSKLILLRSILSILISLQLNAASPEHSFN